jgi:hypothetical protein
MTIILDGDFIFDSQFRDARAELKPGNAALCNAA